jgi:hypothetical protein
MTLVSCKQMDGQKKVENVERQMKREIVKTIQVWKIPRWDNQLLKAHGSDLLN